MIYSRAIRLKISLGFKKNILGNKTISPNYPTLVTCLVNSHVIPRKFPRNSLKLIPKENFREITPDIFQENLRGFFKKCSGLGHWFQGYFVDQNLRPSLKKFPKIFPGMFVKIFSRFKMDAILPPYLVSADSIQFWIFN